MDLSMCVVYEACRKIYSCFEPRGSTIPQLCLTNNRNYPTLCLHALLSALLCIGPQVWQIRLLSEEGADTISKCKWVASFQCWDSVGTYIFTVLLIQCACHLFWSGNYEVCWRKKMEILKPYVGQALNQCRSFDRIETMRKSVLVSGSRGSWLKKQQKKSKWLASVSWRIRVGTYPSGV